MEKPPLDYQTMRLSVWAIHDALQAASSIAARASGATDGTDACVVFETVRKEISDLLTHGEAMKAARVLMHQARTGLDVKPTT